MGGKCPWNRRKHIKEQDCLSFSQKDVQDRLHVLKDIKDWRRLWIRLDAGCSMAYYDGSWGKLMRMKWNFIMARSRSLDILLCFEDIFMLRKNRRRTTECPDTSSRSTLNSSFVPTHEDYLPSFHRLSCIMQICFGPLLITYAINCTRVDLCLDCNLLPTWDIEDENEVVESEKYELSNIYISHLLLKNRNVPRAF